MQEILMNMLQQLPYSIVLYATGVGSTALQLFTLYPGSSSFALECSNFYASGSLQILLNHPIEKYVSEQIAEEMALKALIKSHEILSKQESSDSQKFLHVLGVGLTGAIRSANPRHGKHHAHVCLNFGSRIFYYYFDLQKGERTRQEEDELISLKLYELIVYHSNQNQGKFSQMFLNEKVLNQQIVIQPIQLGKLELVKQLDNICMFQMLTEKSEYLHSMLINAKSYQLNPILQNSIILSGSFNPIHQGHLELAEIAAQKMGGHHETYFELSITNADKGAINYEEIWRRINLLREKNLKVILSNRPLFKDKNIFLQDGAFVIGADTYKRLIDTKYYNNSISERDISFIKFLQNNNKIIVAPRYNETTQKLENLWDFEIPPLIAKNVVEIQGFRNDLSSTQIRKKDNIRAASMPH